MRNLSALLPTFQLFSILCMMTKSHSITEVSSMVICLRRSAEGDEGGIQQKELLPGVSLEQSRYFMVSEHNESKPEVFFKVIHVIHV